MRFDIQTSSRFQTTRTAPACADTVTKLYSGSKNARARSTTVITHGHHAAGGGERNRTDDLLLAKQALSRLSYTPVSEVREQKKENRRFGHLRFDFCHLTSVI